MHQKIASNPKELWLWLKEIASQLNWKKSHVFTIKEYRKKRSLQANRLYWLIITAIADSIGDEKENVHVAYKKKFLKWKEVELPGGLNYWVEGSTPDADSKEFSEYIEKIYIHSNEFLGLNLPRPDDELFGLFAEKYEKYSQI